MTAVLNTILPVVVMLAIGVIARKKHIISGEGIEGIKSFVTNFTLPAVLIEK